jgi:hypothetical protein
LTVIATLERQVRALMAEGRFEAAEAQVRLHLATGTGPVPLWRLLAQALRPQGRMVETRAIQELLVQAVPGDLPGRLDLAETALLLGDCIHCCAAYNLNELR